jgi:hypothetical protein
LKQPASVDQFFTPQKDPSPRYGSYDSGRHTGEQANNCILF